MALNRIILQGDRTRTKTFKCSVAVKPGMLIAFATAGDAGKIKPHASAGQNAVKMFAVEESYRGGGIDDVYAINDQVKVYPALAGDEINGLLANGQNVAIGDPLESDGAGGLQKHTPQTVNEGGAATFTIYLNAIVAYALEAVNNSSGAQARIKVQVA